MPFHTIVITNDSIGSYSVFVVVAISPVTQTHTVCGAIKLGCISHIYMAFVSNTHYTVVVHAIIPVHLYSLFLP